MSQPLPTTPTCESCRWWQRGKLIVEIKTELPGKCHRYPSDVGGRRPSVEAGDWCGEHSSLSEVKLTGLPPAPQPPSPTLFDQGDPGSAAPASPNEASAPEHRPSRRKRPGS